ncbi:RNA/RNP complex-1-interacting phosphatase isoform X2 [Drosophila simulans]|uniref:RNA/RNP complex-1-interacting phosphatase isoform X2 n=1 Tax=Drosophila simulans TaxID=7240 RepID=UPI00192CFF6D|nr:RNA/RNP complex-1-interacting phosphatase isoform X2 [Drosophila simulans]
MAPIHVNAKVEENLRLAPESLLQFVPDLGLIIDLTNTDRYYHPSAITNHDVRHQKLMIPGKQTPSHKLAERFCAFVKDFLESNADNDKLIGVHCTHGVNRTGYLICYFMISVMNKSPEEAIQTFSLARGHEIERNNYLSSLKTLPNRETASKLAATERRSSTIEERDVHQKYKHRLSGGFKAISYQEDGGNQHPYSRNHRPHPDEEQYRFQSNRSGGGYQQGSNQHHYSRNHRPHPDEEQYRFQSNRSGGGYQQGSNQHPYSRNHRPHPDEEQYRFQSNRSGGGYQQGSNQHPYSRNHRPHPDEEQYRIQNNRSGGGYQLGSRSYQQDPHQRYQRNWDYSRRNYSERNYSEKNYSERNYSKRNYSEIKYSDQK